LRADAFRSRQRDDHGRRGRRHGDQTRRRDALPGRLVRCLGRSRDGAQDVRRRQDQLHVIDPLERWRELGLPDKPNYAGLLTYAGMPYTQDPRELVAVDVAIVGAPTDDVVSDRPGTRFGPRAIRAASCPPGPHLEAGIDAYAELRIVDFGDAAVIPA